MRKALFGLVLGLLVASAAAHAAPDPAQWRPLDPENTLYLDTPHGRVVVEVFPELAPNHVARVKELTRSGFYDGLAFHRVIDNFMAQTGDPLGTGEGGSDKPDLQGEFLFRRGPDIPFVEAALQGGARLGFYKSMPISTQPDLVMAHTRDGRAAAWGLHCPGVASMARTDDPNSANSQFFLMRQAYPSLDKRYTAWGRVVWNLEAVRKIAVGEPPARPDRLLAMRVAADLSEEERAPIYVMRTESPPFRDLVEDLRKKRKADFSVCDVEIPTRVADTSEKGKSWWRAIPLLP